MPVTNMFQSTSLELVSVASPRNLKHFHCLFVVMIILSEFLLESKSSTDLQTESITLSPKCSRSFEVAQKSGYHDFYLNENKSSLIFLQFDFNDSSTLKHPDVIFDSVDINVSCSTSNFTFETYLVDSIENCAIDFSDLIRIKRMWMNERLISKLHSVYCALNKSVINLLDEISVWKLSRNSGQQFNLMILPSVPDLVQFDTNLSIKFHTDERCNPQWPSFPENLCKIREHCVQECGLQCDFESPCEWEGTTLEDEHGFQVMTSADFAQLPREKGEQISAPTKDADSDEDGHYLYFRSKPNMDKVHAMVSSPWFTESELGCTLNMFVHMGNMQDGSYRIFVESRETAWDIIQQPGDDLNKWIQKSQLIGRITQEFRIVVEVVQGNLVPSHIALDNLKLINCFPDPLRSSDCGQNKFKCDSSLCIKRDRVCDLTEDCLLGEDERESCDEMPESSVCTFEKNLCGWKNLKSDQMEWTLHNGSTPTERTGPSYDHTYKNISGSYLYIEASNYKLLGHVAILESPVFNPPPRYHGDTSSRYFNVCKIRFFYHMFGNHIGFLNVYVEEKSSKFSRGWKHDIWEMSKNMGNVWLRGTAILPNITNRYTIQFHARRGIRYSGDIAIDDISLSPECFGINVPDNETVHYPIESDHISYHHNYREHNRTDQSILRLSTCGSKGRYGPTQRECDYAYNSSHIKILLKDGKSTGIQQWTVPSSTIYTIVAIGASGGRGVRNNGKSYGGMAKAAFNLTEGEKIFILVGQKGIDACSDYPNTDISLMHQCSRNSKLKRDLKSLKELTRLSKIGGGGGGGGATYVFKVDSYSNQLIPLLVAGGGGGFSSEVNMENVFASNAVAFNGTQSGLNGFSSRIDAGSGGGWKDKTKYFSSGFSLVEGGFGGSVCKSATKWYTDGGFGGGGGACSSGGGGGGYTGGNSTHGMSSGRNGKGGTSFISRYGLFPNMGLSQHLGDGQVIIIKAFTGCGCEHLCVVVDHATMGFRCICPTSFILESDGFTCQPSESALKENIAGSLSDHYLIIIIIGAVSFAILFFVALIFACNSYRNHMAKQLQQEGLMNAELQLSRLRQATGGMITEYNPNYEFGGGTCSVQDLKQVSRESLTLVKALGQGAFGEVYQGYLSNIPDEPGNVPVAVKTLPELSSNQAELDFLTEAQIMSKFNHPNIVRFIGVCFEKLPQFIVLELLSGGDLKSFLRESRPKPMKNSNLNSSSPLTMRDLLMLAVDVAKGCQYLEEHHFIHRDIAARNCLLTTKGAGRIVKIADFGMARDVYRADYYRKGGKAMLPVKWMPPEAFLDGIFTSKTDIWSFGVLIWEVMSLGYMPYPGRGNQEVMQLVTSGGRLEPPSNCPQPMYHIMTQCWHPVPEQRPNFMTILERLGYCLQDPDVINSPLPVFYRPPSTERDATVMRPNNETDGACLQVQRSLTNSSSADYLIPIPSSNYSISTEKTELHSPSSVESMTKLLELDDNRSSNNSQIPPKSLCWETSFSDEKLGDINDPPLDSIPTPPPPPRSSILSNAVRPRRPEGYTKIPSQDDDLHNAAMPDNMPYSYLSNGKVTNPCNSIARSAPPNRYSDNPYNKVNKDSQDKNGMVVKPSPIGKMRKADDGNKYNPSVDQRHSSLSLDASALCRQANGQPQPVPYVNVPISQSGRSNLPLVRALSCDRYSPNSLQNTNQPRGANQSSPSIERGHQDGEVNC